MSNLKRGSLSNAARTLLLLMSSALIASCGGGSSSSTETAGIGGTGIVAGRITGFGSVFVNGSQFDTTTSSFVVDGVTGATEDDLEVGMVVLLEVETKNGRFTSRAERVIYDDEVQGPIAALPQVVMGSGGSQKTFQVFGQTVTIDQTSTAFNDVSGMGGFDFGSITADDLVEISGFRTSASEIVASYVEKQGVLQPGVSEVELRGTIANLDTGALTFEVDGVIIDYSAASIDVDSSLANGLLVEVEGVIQADGSVRADEVEEEVEGFGNNVDDVSLQGVITGYTDLAATFFIDSQEVDASGASLSPANAASQLKDGVNIEVEGDIVGGVLIAEELELREGEAGLASYVNPGSVNLGSNSFTVSFATLPGAVTVRADAQTAFEDEAGPNPLENMTLGDLTGGDYVLVEGREVGGELVASTIKRTDAEDSLKLEGEVDDYLAGNYITVLGIQYGLDMDTEYAPIDPPDIQIGDIVEIEDEDDPVGSADGIADEVEEEN